MRLVAIDPGVLRCGVAHFQEGALVDAFLQETAVLKEALCMHDFLVIEMPRIYHGSGQRKGDLNDLLDLAAVVGRAETLALYHRRVFPAEWKGQVPKKIMNARVLAALTAAERGVIKHVGAKDHNIIDAIGIGLFQLRRL